MISATAYSLCKVGTVRASRLAPASVYRRALMYVPASDERKLSKVPKLFADCVVLDCEDGVAEAGKRAARLNVAKLLQDHRKQRICSGELGWRVNSVSSGLLEEDLKEIAKHHAWPDAIMLPKVNSLEDLKIFYQHYKAYMTHVKEKINLVIWIESTKALLSMNKLLTACSTSCTFTTMSLDGVVFGSDDFCVDLGVSRSNSIDALSYARQKFVTTCKAHCLQAIDMVYTNIDDLDGLREECVNGSRIGFTGKQVIHPSHVQIVQDAFLPSEDSVKRSRELLACFQQSEAKGKGAFLFKGDMVDMPLVLQAQRIVNVYDGIKNKQVN